MNLFTISRQAVTLDSRAGHGNTFNLRRFVGGLLAALTGVVMAFSAPSEAYAQTTYTSTGGATINASGAASVFPIPISVSGIGTVGDIQVTLTNLSHTWPNDIDIVLQSPSGATSIIIADRIGGSGGISGRDYTFAIGATAIPTTGFPVSGTYGVAGTAYGNAIPAGPHTANLGNFLGTSGDGTWNLYIHDDTGGDSGSLGSWSITLTGGAACTVSPPACATDLGAVATVQNDDPFCCDNTWDMVCQDLYDALSSTCTTNDLCILADPISCGDTVSGTTVGATLDGVAFCGTSNTAPGVWYSLAGPAAGSPVSVSTCTGTTYDSKISVFSGSCGSLVCVGGNDDACAAQSTVNFVSDGSNYLILVHGFSSSTGAFDLTVTCSAPPATGECTNAVAFGTGAAPTNNIPVTISTCTYQSEYNTLSGVVAGNTYISDYQIASASNGWVTVRSGSASGPVVATGNAPLTWTAAVAGTHYIHYNTSDACGTASNCGVTSITCSSCPPPPSLAWCDVATPIACNASASGSTVGAPTDAIPATCGTTNGTGGKVAYTISGTGNEINASLLGSSYDTKIWVFETDGSCEAANLVCVGGNDDFGGLQSEFSWISNPGTDYLIVVGGFSSNEGAYVLNVLCGPFGCTDPAACNYDAGAASDDGSCFFTCNDVPSGAIDLAVTSLGTCSALAQDMNDATTNVGGFYFGFGNDLWYSFTAVTSGVRIEVSTSTVDAMVEVRDAATNTFIEGEDQLFVNGSEILNFGGLTAGEDYLIRVADYNSGSTSRPFDICVQFLPDTQCDYPVGVTSTTRSLCQNAKADWVAGGTNYTFHFTPVGGGSTITYETGAAFTIAPLQNVPGLLWDSAYDVEIDVALSLTTGNGSSEAITVLSSNTCELVISPAPSAALRASDNLANAGPLPLGAYVAATPWVCTASEWEWVFTNTNGSQLPIVHFSGAPSRFVRLFDVSGLNAGDVYNVQVRPVFATGYQGAFGATDQIAIIGALGMVEDVTSPVANTEIDERVEETIIEAGVALYPNPNRGDFVNVNIANVAEGVDRVIFDLYDLTGKRVISEQIAVAGSGVNVVMPLNGLADGMYIANIIIGDKVHTERIAVQK